KAYAAHFRRINESLPAAAPAAKPAAPAAKVEAAKPEALRPEAPKPEAAAAPVAELAAAEAAKASRASQMVSSGAGYWLQLASLVSRDKAQAAWADATGRAGALLGQRQAFVQVHAQVGVTYHRLLTGPFETLAQARDFAARLGAQGIKPVIKRDVGAIEPLKP
ncbi:MAG TPA: SPOR domain-containing protein, partial [Pedomonas sp.]|uniref:SPOR domain-containing protein n=1 Tax=Pedomonas sp. TaxID=2976421 RepID=UPI002F424BF8